MIVPDGSGKLYLIRSQMDELILKRRDYLYEVPSVLALHQPPHRWIIEKKMSMYGKR